MKKLITILLILLFLLNIVGYYALSMMLQYRHNDAIAIPLEQNSLDEQPTFEIRIPLTVPYGRDANTFEPAQGQFAYHGEYYQMVKQKLAHDTLTVVCLKDQQQKKIHGALVDLVTSFTDKHDAKPSGAKSLVSMIKDYLQQSTVLVHQSNGWENALAQTTKEKVFIQSWSGSILHPPERA